MFPLYNKVLRHLTKAFTRAVLTLNSISPSTLQSWEGSYYQSTKVQRILTNIMHLCLPFTLEFLIVPQTTSSKITHQSCKRKAYWHLHCLGRLLFCSLKAKSVSMEDKLQSRYQLHHSAIRNLGDSLNSLILRSQIWSCQYIDPETQFIKK